MSTGLYDLQGRRLYCTADERKAFLKEAAKHPNDVALFCQLLVYSGCRISEALAITPQRIDTSTGVVIFETLKKRKRGVFRAVPLPNALIESLQRLTANKPQTQRLWPWCRTKAWQEVKAVMTAMQTDGPHATAKGLRHGFAINALQAGVPLNMVSKWLGHSSLEITAIYTNAFGNEERSFAQRMWT
ncbi:MAG: site-specific integrase [Methylocystaceae bacterium]|nr:site-specific integrase [Methylocystaceae bacterium]